MPANILEGALGRPAEEFLAAADICADVWRRDNDNLWVGGMVASAWWVCGFTPYPPMEPDREVVATRGEILEQLMLAGRAKLDKAGPHSTRATWGRGVYRMLIYAIGYRDELPLDLAPRTAARV